MAGSSDKNKRLEVLLVFVVAISQVLQAGWSLFLSERTKKEIQETNRVHMISQKMLESIPRITGSKPSEAKVTLAALYVMAKKDSDKKNLVRIAILSGKKELRDASFFIIDSDDSISNELNGSLLALMNKKVVEQIDNRNKEVQREQQNTGGETMQENTDTAIMDVPITVTPEVKASASLTAKGASAGDVSGWIYLGKKDSKEQLLEDKTVVLEKVPAENDEITTSTFVTLRDAGTSKGSKVLGVLPKGQKVKVLQVPDGTKLQSGAKAVWARVRVITNK
ncbi:hypothetical protein IQ216_01430 [Cyanobium sp. LEGE 06143]|uniref:hypothetical protein n=1 Tax=Cyanobium sp. LEGE 06143 TaxID=945727 RepID=UPI00187F23CB|nr:hypothetical protein [Cyanobium sp. LEGE 06143]MBE9171790.1 hypothetical protein [Cyanobium sp. LEGE 06143]